MKIAEVRKAIVATVGVILTTLFFGGELVPLEWRPYVAVAFAVATYYGVWRVPNASKQYDPQHRAE